MSQHFERHASGICSSQTTSVFSNLGEGAQHVSSNIVSVGTGNKCIKLNPFAKQFITKQNKYYGDIVIGSMFSAFCLILAATFLSNILQWDVGKYQTTEDLSQLGIANNTVYSPDSSFLSIPPSVLNISTPEISYISEISHINDHLVINLSSEEEHHTMSILKPTIDSSRRFKPNPDAPPFIPMGHPEATDDEIDSDQDSPYSILHNLRLKNVEKIVIGHLNINSVRNKMYLLGDLIKDKVDIMLISETKLDSTFPTSQFVLQGYSSPFRLDRTAHGGGLLLYLRSDIPSKSLPLISDNIECIICEITISKKKWLLVGSYNPKKSLISNHLSALSKNLDHYLSSFDNVIIFGDLNSEIREESMSDFCSIYALKSLIKVPTCFKSNENPSCIDLILTNKPHSFQNSTVLETGLSDFHMLICTVMKTSFRKKPPKVIRYRNYKHYSHFNFQNELNFCLAGIDLNEITNDSYVSLLMELLNKHAPLKMKYVRANDQPFMTKELRKEHMKRTRMKNKYLKNRNEENFRIYKKQRNRCVFLLKETKKTYFENLHPSKISDNKKFWKTVNPFFTEKATSTDDITLIENREIISDDRKVAEVFNNFFSNAVKNLNIDYYEHFSFDKYFLCRETENPDPVLKAIEKYENHPSILKIKENIPEGECFSFKQTNLKSVIKEICNLDDSKSFPIESMPAKILKEVSDIVVPKIVIDFNSSI